MTRPVQRRMFVTTFTVPAGSITGTNVVLDDMNLDKVRIVIPPGHAGLTALQIQQSGVPIFPYGSDPFIRGNDEVIDFAWDYEIQANGLQLLGFNSDIFDHSWTLRWELTDLAGAVTAVAIDSPQGAAPAPADVAAISSLDSGSLL